MTKKFFLTEKDMPTQWYNIVHDLPRPPVPPLNPGTGKPLGPDDLAPLFPMAIIGQLVSPDSWIDIPEEVQDIYRMWRPSPLYRAERLEKALDTPAKIYFKWEGVSPPGSHKPNTAIPQAYYAREEGVKKFSTETGAGQWGSSLAFAGALFDIEVKVYMVKVSYHQKPYRRVLMETWGAEVIPSPSDQTNSGRGILEKDPDSPGSLGIAISEAVEEAATNDDIKYSIGSVFDFVLLHQTVIGLEAIKQFEMTGDYPDVLVGCVGGGSNFAGFFFPFMQHKLSGDKPDLRVVCVEPEASPSMTRGKYAYDFGDTAQVAPLAKMHTLGHSFVPKPIHAGGLRYHGMAPLVSDLYDQGLIEATALHQNATFESAVQFARTEGFVSGPEPAHAIHGVFLEAQKAKEEGKEKVIAFNFSGHGHFDLEAYDRYLSDKLEDYSLPQEEIEAALEGLPPHQAPVMD
jgi:tryptophan synthase beta chain